MKINVNIVYPEDKTILYEKAADILSDILIKRLQPKEVKRVIEILEDENYEITW
ncbi:hypothetical protein [Clostridium sp. LP20]|uniref:hypothetical protein n=1 Tax=Clostridium sp. LP20 TaxID=3418665 RepID=UPI003EE80A38